MRVIRGIKVGDLVEIQLLAGRRGIGIVVGIINEKFSPLMLEVCFPCNKTKRKKTIKVRANRVRVVSETR